MKFARVLEDSQTSEWRKGYIDYRGLKKLIGVIKAAQRKNHEEIIKSVDEDRTRSRSASPPRRRSLAFEEPPDVVQRRNRRMSAKSDPHGVRTASFLARGGENRLSLWGIIPSFIGSGPGSRGEMLGARSLRELRTMLTQQETSFFEALDKELDRVEAFYLDREKEMTARGRSLQIQLNELIGHGISVQNAHTRLPWSSNIMSAIKGGVNKNRATSPVSACPSPTSDTTRSTLQSSETLVSILRFEPQSQIPSVAFNPTPGKRRDVDFQRKDLKLKRKQAFEGPPPDVDPEGYLYAKRRLKNAVLEHYRGLELLQNYGIINNTGFRKIVKKFEKVTKITVQDQYMAEKVETSCFSSRIAIQDLMKEMEDKYANAFVRGDRKKATSRLRAGAVVPLTYHLSTFRAGIYLGLALPALIDGLYKAFQQTTREAIPAWGTLLFLYGVLFVPTTFALLVGLNMAVWASVRINYAFIFDLEVLSRIDYRKYYEIPAVLLSSLLYTFWLCFARIRFPFAPTLWPLIWVFFAVGLIINPLPIMHRSSRFWFLRNLGRQFISGRQKVEFRDFWMGDQLCSLTFTLSHIPMLLCLYIHHITDSFPTNIYATCGITTNMWPAEFIFTSLPYLIRLLQSMKRYRESKRSLHLVNAGKYLAGIVATLFYAFWRRNDHGAFLALWCVSNTFASLYGCVWDLLYDWSLLDRKAKFPLLRVHLIYTSYIPLYYIAMVTNLLMRFAWVCYIPNHGTNLSIRTFIVGVVEMLRRWQWNFLRLENEHIGNMDQYRVTREVPLLYPVERVSRDEEEIEDEKLFRVKIKQKSRDCKTTRDGSSSL